MDFIALQILIVIAAYFLGSINKKYKLKYSNLSSIKGVENKILYVNFLIDQKENMDIDIKV